LEEVVGEEVKSTRITIEPGKMGGSPCIRGMRLTVRRVLEILATYPDRGELFADYPDGTIDIHIDAA
jgi:uncharacterized protein (DUF433 family)